MGEFLPKENLCEKEGRERLPSPHDLQGKIILKGSFKAVSACVVGKYGIILHEKYLSTLHDMYVHVHVVQHVVGQGNSMFFFNR